MIETRALYKSVSRIISKYDSVNRPQKWIAIDRHSFFAQPQHFDPLVREHPCCFHTLGRIRVRRQPSRNGLAVICCGKAGENIEEAADLARIVGGSRRIFHAEPVRLALVVPAEPEKNDADSRLGQISELAYRRRQNAS